MTFRTMVKRVGTTELGSVLGVSATCLFLVTSNSVALAEHGCFVGSDSHHQHCCGWDKSRFHSCPSRLRQQVGSSRCFSIPADRQRRHGRSICLMEGSSDSSIERKGESNTASKKENDDIQDAVASDSSEETTIKEVGRTWNPLRLAVLKLGMTELRWTSPLNYEKRDGTYSCAYCGNNLFDSRGKYDSGSGWPSFWKTAADGTVALQREWDGRIECRCQKCGSHLGHVFPDGPSRTDVPSSDLGSIPQSDIQFGNSATRLPRYCINGASLRFEPWE